MKTLWCVTVASAALSLAACTGDTFAPAGAGPTGGIGGTSAGAGGAVSGGATAAGRGGASTAGGKGGASGTTAAGSAGGPGGNAGASGGDAGGAGGGDGGAGGIAGSTVNGGAGGKAGAAGAAGKSGGAGSGGTAGAAGANGGTGGGSAGTAGSGATAGVGGASGAAGGAGKAGSAGQAGSGGGGSTFPSNRETVGNFGSGTGEPITFDGTFDTTTSCKPSAPLGDCVKVDAPIKGAAELCVCRPAASLTLGNVALVGNRALVLLVAGSVTVTGSVRILSGEPVAAAPAYAPPSGGGFGAAGGNKIPESEARGNVMLVPLLTGQTGSNGGFGVAGGRGGGALQISASGVIKQMAGSLVDAGGEPGLASTIGPGNISGSGPGGGSGGAILLEAPELDLSGTIVANGASGSGGSGEKAGQPGKKGSTTKAQTEGGAPGTFLCETAAPVPGRFGGLGGALSSPSGGSSGQAPALQCGTGQIAPAQGGGGGGVGRIVLRATKAPVAIAATVSPAPFAAALP